jgi:hypothetical protein
MVCAHLSLSLTWLAFILPGFEVISFRVTYPIADRSLLMITAGPAVALVDILYRKLFNIKCYQNYTRHIFLFFSLSLNK